jgi:hypothetical protein
MMYRRRGGGYGFGTMHMHMYGSIHEQHFIIKIYLYHKRKNVVVLVQSNL